MSDTERLKLARRTFRNRAISSFLALLVVVPLVGWRIYRTYAVVTRPKADDVTLFVEGDGTIPFSDRSYSKSEATLLLNAIVAAHPRAFITVCTGGNESFTGALAYAGMTSGVKVGFIKDPSNGLCRR
jgi:hypothetical protein